MYFFRLSHFAIEFVLYCIIFQIFNHNFVFFCILYLRHHVSVTYPVSLYAILIQSHKEMHIETWYIWWVSIYANIYVHEYSSLFCITWQNLVVLYNAVPKTGSRTFEHLVREYASRRTKKYIKPITFPVSFSKWLEMCVDRTIY